MLTKFQRAVAAREKIRESDTNALRLIDGFDDLEVDDFAGRWLVQTRGDRFPEWVIEAASSRFIGGENRRDADFTLPVSIHWKKLGDQKPPEWVWGGKIEAPFVARENGVQFWIDFQAGSSPGLFLDQRENRRRIRELARRKTVLNCFAYTCAFGVCAALGGGRTLNVDLSRRYLDWGKRNYELNGIDPATHEFFHGDVFHWLDRFRKKQRRFDLVVLDPPTFARDDKGRVFTIETGFDRLMSKAVEILAPGGCILCSTNQRSLTPRDFRKLILRGLHDAARWTLESAPMPPDFTGEAYLKTWWVRWAMG
jgi:23S rRNA (cytosine1962-C5)-methyltransferase